MINNRIFLLLLIFIMIICSGKSYKVNEHFILNRTFTLNDIDDKLTIEVKKTSGTKCPRCWKILKTKCVRCEEANVN